MQHQHHTPHTKQQASQVTAFAGFALILFGLAFGFHFGGGAYRESVELATHVPALNLQITNLQDDLDRLDRLEQLARRANKGDLSEADELRTSEKVQDKQRDVQVKMLDLKATASLLSFSFWSYKLAIMVACCLTFLGAAMVWWAYHEWWGFVRHHTGR
jgi:hypothetical protein